MNRAVITITDENGECGADVEFLGDAMKPDSRVRAIVLVMLNACRHNIESVDGETYIDEDES